MNKVKLLYIIFILPAVFISCSKSNGFKINGTVTNSKSRMIYLEKLEVNDSTPFDSSKIDQQGNFKLRGEIAQPTFFLLKLNDQKFITLLIDSSEDITFSADYINFSSDYKIEGSTGSKKVQELNQHLMHTITRIDSINSLIKINANIPNEKIQNTKREEEIREIYANQEAFSKKFIMDNPFSMASILAIYQKLNDNTYVVQDLQTIKVAASALYSIYPNSEHAKTLYEDTKKLMKTAQDIEIQKLVETKGVNSPEIDLPDQTGKRVTLSSLKGKYVILQFWSSHDPDSRVMNSILKENYKKFHPKGLEIYQVSIDTSRQEWIKAIHADQMDWINVNDLHGSIGAITGYNIRIIPYNYLLDKEGVIIAKDLKGPALYNTLSEILN